MQKKILDLNNLERIGGVAQARNYGLSHANGEYIAFVDNDDLLCSKMYEALISNLEEQNCDVSCCTYSKDYDSYEAVKKNLANCQLTNEEVLVISGLNDIYDSIVRGKGHKAIEGLIWNKVYKKSIIGDLKFNEHISLVDDADFTLRLFRNVRKVCYVDAVFYHWMQHITNQTKTGGYEKCSSAAHAYENMVQYVSGFITNKNVIDILSEQSLNWNIAALNKYILQDNIEKSEMRYYATVIGKYRYITNKFPKKEKLKIVMIERAMPIYRLWYVKTRK